MKNITDIKYKKGKSSRGEIMKKVIIISLGNKTGKSLYEQLKSILDEKIYVNFYSNIDFSCSDVYKRQLQDLLLSPL